HLGDEALEALPVRGARSGLAEVTVDDDDAIERPAERDGALAKCILALSAFGVLQDLSQRRLAHVQVCHAREMRARDFLVSLAVHGHGRYPSVDEERLVRRVERTRLARSVVSS